MKQKSVLFLHVLAPGLALLLALLGLETLEKVAAGWFLLVGGVVCAAGIVIAYWVRKDAFWQRRTAGLMRRGVGDTRSLWVIGAGALAAFFAPPLEYLYAAPLLPRGLPTQELGGAFIVLGLLALGAAGFRSLVATPGTAPPRRGVAAVMRRPALAGLLLMALGVGTSYSSAAGLLMTVALLLPALVHRISVEAESVAGSLPGSAAGRRI